MPTYFESLKSRIIGNKFHTKKSWHMTGFKQRSVEARILQSECSSTEPAGWSNIQMYSLSLEKKQSVLQPNILLFKFT